MVAATDFNTFGASLDSPATHATAITPNDSTDLANVCRAIWVGTAGDLKVTTVGGDTVTFPALTQGWHPLMVSRIWATGTSASGIVAVR